MRIGLMLRPLEEKGGIGVYTKNLVTELLALDRHNQYVLFYINRDKLGQFAHYSNVQEVYLPGLNKAVWDQIQVPWACWRYKVDLVFHPKFTVPLLAPCQAAMVLHGADFFIPEHLRLYDKSRWRIYYNMILTPLYFKKCATVISVSRLTSDSFNQIFKLPVGKITTVYFGPAKHFRRISDPVVLRQVKEKYHLPDRFILTLTGYNRGKRKNFDSLLMAFRLFHGRTDHKLVVGGQDCYKFKVDYKIPEAGFGQDVIFPGWLDQTDLPAIYSLADLYLYPSNLEAFPIPLTEAMACGTPIITSNLNGLKEIAGEAALFVEADQPQKISDAMVKVLTDTKLQEELRAKGLARSSLFNWTICARQILALLEATARTPEKKRWQE